MTDTDDLRSALRKAGKMLGEPENIEVRRVETPDGTILVIGPLAAKPAAPSEPANGCSCDWPGCQGQCHTGDTCPCHAVAPASPSQPGGLPDWTAKRAALTDRWASPGLSPITAYEMAGAVYRDSVADIENGAGSGDGVEDRLEVAAYDRRGLLNLVAALLDRLDPAVQPSAADRPDLPERIASILVDIEHSPGVLVADDESLMNVARKIAARLADRTP